MGMLTYVIKIFRKILPFSYPFVEIRLQDWSLFFAYVVFTHDTFHSNLRQADIFLLTPSAPKWNKERPKIAIRRYEL